MILTSPLGITYQKSGGNGFLAKGIGQMAHIRKKARISFTGNHLELIQAGTVLGSGGGKGISGMFNISLEDHLFPFKILGQELNRLTLNFF